MPFHIRPGEVRFQFDNDIIVHVRNDDGGYASVVAWDGRTGWPYDPPSRFFMPNSEGFPDQTMSAVELADFLWEMSHYPKRVT